MIIDFHTHIFPDKIADAAIAKLSADSNSVPCIRATYDCLNDSMKEAGVDMSIVLPVVTNPVKASNINQSAARTNERTAETGIFSFGGIHPETENYKEVLKEAKELGLKGIKLHPDYYQVMFNDIRMKKIIDYASELGLITITHAGTDIGLYPPVYCPVDAILEVVNEVKPENLVLAHMGGWQMWDQVIEKLADKNVYIDTAFSIGKIDWVDKDKIKPFRMLTDDEFVNMVKVIGADRILFATDSPWAGQKDYVERIKAMPITEEEKDKIFHKTASKLLGL